MFFQLHRFVREVVTKELQALINEHPFYTTIPATSANPKERKMQRSPVIVQDNYNFDGRNYPAVVIKTSSSTEFRLSMDKLIEEVSGHVRLVAMLPYIVQKVEDDKTYTGAYTNGTYRLEFTNVGRENKREIMLRTTQQVAVEPPTPTPAPVIKYFTVTPEQWRTDIIPGARLYFGEFNDLEIGKSIYIEMFEDKTYLGDMYGSGFDFTLNAMVYAQTQNEAQELTDIVNALFTYLMVQKLYYGYGILLKSIETNNVIIKEGEVGEEYFTGELTITGFTEHQFFIPYAKVEGYELWLELRSDVDLASPGDLAWPLDSDIDPTKRYLSPPPLHSFNVSVPALTTFPIVFTPVANLGTVESGTALPTNWELYSNGSLVEVGGTFSGQLITAITYGIAPTGLITITVTGANAFTATTADFDLYLSLD